MFDAVIDLIISEIKTEHFFNCIPGNQLFDLIPGRSVCLIHKRFTRSFPLVLIQYASGLAFGSSLFGRYDYDIPRTVHVNIAKTITVVPFLRVRNLASR